MDHDIDRSLRMIATADHAGLAGVQTAVLRRLHVDNDSNGMAPGMAAMAALCAIALGIATGISGTDAAQAAPVDPLAGAGPLAPSTLLQADQ